MYNVELTGKAKKQLSKLNSFHKKIVSSWIQKNLYHCDNPRQYGKALKGNLKGLWRYRVGDYRIIADIQDDKVLILVLEIADRKEVYR